MSALPPGDESPASIEELRRTVAAMSAREEIYQCIQRYARGVDRFDRELLVSAFHPDAIDDHGKFVVGPEEFADRVFEQHSRSHLSHQHLLLNHTCELEGDGAYAEMYFVFVGMNREGPPLAMNGGRYLDRFERRDGRWAIAYRLVLRDWAMLDERPDLDDLSSLTSTRAHLPDAIREFMNQGAPARRDRDDPSYRRPLTVEKERLEAWERLDR